MKIIAPLLGAVALSILAVPAFAAGNVQAASPGAAAGAASSDEAMPGTSGPSDESMPDASASSAEPAALAPAGMVLAKDPQSVLSALATLGYPGKLEKLDSGRSSINVQISGLTTYIDFYDCADDMTDCYTLLFNVSLDLKDGATLDQENKWNSQQITGRVWLDDTKDPTLDFSLSTFDGISEDAFDQNVKLWDKKIGDFKDFFNF
jgi:hypothetical protein